MHPIPALHQQSSRARLLHPTLADMPPSERAFVRSIADEFARKQPALLLVDSDPPSQDMKGFDYLDYLDSDPRFATAIAAYELKEQVGHFRVYERRPSPRLLREVITQTAVHY